MGKPNGKKTFREAETYMGNEIETLAHILGACPHSDIFRDARHYKVRYLIAQVFRERKFKVYEEVHGVSETGSHRRIDIIAVQPDSSPSEVAPS